ncbi:serine/threonine-protein kinase [Streptomyces sp. NPDC005728]|uniref:serine/threonine-protein kinase n=1 Tax=Streptomyces sp. NPDC005728 TaxID=3157054 RepID=UPI0033CE305D
MPGTQRLIAGRYRLQHPLADGGFGRVWHAHDERLDADVVVKEVLLPPAANRDEHARRLKYAEREARNAAKLRHHPNIVPVYDVAIEDDRPWIVMELIDGGSLENRLDKGPLAPNEAAELAEALLKALEAAHRAGIVHRDVKPANIMLSTDGRILLTDFGIASHQADARLTVTGEIIGTLEYLAPERLGGAGVTPASDLFALGVTLFRAVEDASPFLRDSQAATLAALAMDEPPPLQRAGQFAPLILGLLAKDPDARLTVADALVLLRNRHLTATTVSQPQPAANDGPFEAAWTGKEPLDSYTEKVPTRSWQSYAGWAVATAAVTVPLVAVVAALGPGFHAGDQTGGWITFLIICALTLILPVCLAVEARRTKKFAHVPDVIPGWALHVGPNYIMTTGAAGRREFTWDRINYVTIREFRYRGPYQFTTLSLEFTPASASAPPAPAGWPYPQLPARPASSNPSPTPVCVLGPMAHEQRTELSEALARYGGWRWKPLKRAATLISGVIRRRSVR